jgi:hypothetical protein
LTDGARVIAVGALRTRAWTTTRECGPDCLEAVADELAPSLRWAIAEITRIATS